MYLLTASGVLSIVRDPADASRFLVRSRDETTLRKFASRKPRLTPLADYMFRLSLSESELERCMARHLRRMCYTDFKSHLHSLGETELESLAFRVWLHDQSWPTLEGDLLEAEDLCALDE